MSTIYKVRGIYQYSYHEDGKRRKKSLRCKDKKIAEILKARLDLELEKQCASIPTDITVKEFLDWYDAVYLTKLKPRTRRDVLIILNRFIRETKVTSLFQITPKVMLEWLHGLKPSAKTWNNLRGYLRSFLEKAVPKHIRINPCEQIPTMKVPEIHIQFFTDAEYQKIESAAEQPIKDMIVIARYAGLRIGEILHLEGEDILWDPPLIYVKNKPKWGYTVKNYQVRGIPLSREAVAKLRHLKGKKGVLFGVDGKPYNRFKEDAINRVLKAVGLKEKGFAWHKLRHTFASRAAQNGVSLQQIMVWMGHGDYKTALRYAHMAPGYSPEIEKINLVTATESATA